MKPFDLSNGGGLAYYSYKELNYLGLREFPLSYISIIYAGG
jgi:hypothetical protein